ncbi:ABC transporter permease [Cytobacillus depressus]|uniref:ABC transporter permease n=1 Tax=Cytobacillus depressus TaxID=1602942 RepID=A0A6L3V5L6_9BACI|nr:ABC transporter permease [Cytobacillus depressus]KAB2330514.1 ABC transporter permease [Cytobacillus depressus]
METARISKADQVLLSKSSEIIRRTYSKMQVHSTYKWLILLLGFPVHLVVYFIYLKRRKQDTYSSLLKENRQTLLAYGYKEELLLEFKEQLLRKQAFFGQTVSQHETDKQLEKWAEEQFQKTLLEKTEAALKLQGKKRINFENTFESLIAQPLFLVLSFIPGLLMYIFILLYSNPYLKYIFERLVMSIFVIFGVAFFVFTILYLSPLDPAANILGETATKEQIAAFNHLYGLDQSYLAQLWNAMKGIFTFDLGSSYSGNEEVTASIARKFPITLILTVISLIMAIVIAIPIGIISATKPNSFFDYTFMFIALIGLSIPNFWQGLIFILNFSIKLQWLPATFSPENWLSIIMPAVVLGTGLTASIARMMRSSTLEVINEDYIITAKAKGLPKRQVLWKHAVGNAMIPVITVIGLMFGGMLGGAAVTEKVFNISGIGSFIVDKQFIPDIPSIMGGVVYIAITISLVNLLIDILYAFFDPRIRSKMKQY